MKQSALIFLLVLLAACEPIGPVPGGELSGDLAPAPASWEGVADVEVVQLETTGPYSVNIWMVVENGEMFVASSRGDESNWARRAKRSGLVRLRIGETIYELRAVEVTDEERLTEIAGAFNQKYEGIDAEADFPDVIVFHLKPRD